MIRSVCLKDFNVVLRNKKLCKWCRRTGDGEEGIWAGEEKKNNFLPVEEESKY